MSARTKPISQNQSIFPLREKWQSTDKHNSFIIKPLWKRYAIRIKWGI